MKSITVTGSYRKHGGPPILSEEAVEFIARLTREFRHTRQHIIHRRQNRQKDFLAGQLPAFCEATVRIRSDDWKIADVPKELEDRRVEITGPSADAKMVINAFNSGARVYMSDFEDSQTPTWANTIQGQHNLRAAVRGYLYWKNPDGKSYRLDDRRAVLFVRPRGWHMPEKHILVDGRPAPASLVDFGLFFFNNARFLIDKGSGPYFYLPKLESYIEARLWNDVFCMAQDLLRIRRGTIKATVLIETLPAVFQMNEILYELREHSAGLNCGRWDYIFSFIKKLGHNSAYLMPDRGQLTMKTPFLSSYSRLLVETCHKRNAHALGGMSAYIPVKSNPEANEKALQQVRDDKWREVSHGTGHDGTWVAHPGLVPVAMEVFDHWMKSPNQLSLRHHPLSPYEDDLLNKPEGTVTENGVRTNIRIALEYMASWLNGNGCVPINNLMEDAATAEISRVQLWQWLKHGVTLDNGRTLDTMMLHGIFGEELEELYTRKDSAPYKYLTPADIILDLIQSDKCPEFMTLPAYNEVVRKEEIHA